MLPISCTLHKRGNILSNIIFILLEIRTNLLKRFIELEYLERKKCFALLINYSKGYDGKA